MYTTGCVLAGGNVMVSIGEIYARIKITAGKYLVVIVAQVKLVIELLFQVRVTYQNIGRVCILVQGLYLVYGRLGGAAKIIKVKIRGLVRMIGKIGLREKI